MTSKNDTPQQQGQTTKPPAQQQGQTPSPGQQQGQVPVIRDWASI